MPNLISSVSFYPGNKTVIESNEPSQKHGAVFEDDGETGYFYARDLSSDELFVDAIHLYNSSEVQSKDEPVHIEILWPEDYSCVALLINEIPQVVYDFSKSISYAKNPFPEPPPNTGWIHEKWHDSLRDLFI